ncbi:MAG: hypothetical protein HY721_00685 [Planctomycetes bacterium]|nr:hypothetical protein [Planctomycetota bacterium]
MVLAHQGVRVAEKDLCDLLATGPAGTPVLNLSAIEQHVPGCRIEVGPSSFDRLSGLVTTGAAPIVFVATRHLSHWRQETIHAMVVVAVSDEAVLVNDPALARGSTSVPASEFLPAWAELDFLTAVIKVEKPGHSRLDTAPDR